MKTHPTSVGRSLVLALAALTLPVSVFALGQQPRQPFMIDDRHPEASVVQGSQRLSLDTGVPRALYNVDYAVAPGEPEIMARQYLREHVEILRLGDPTLTDLNLRAIRHGLAGTTVRFEQRYQGLPVLAPDLAVTIDRSNRVTFVMSGYEPGISLPSITPTVLEATARATAGAWINVQGALNFDVTRLVVVPEGKVSRLAWQVRMAPSVSPIGDWEVLVDARTGVVFRAVDRACSATGTGFVFDPDALSAAHALYGAAGFVDGSDVTTPQLDAARSSKTLQDITDLGGGNFKLQGPYAEIVDTESPFKGLFTQAGSTFNYDRAADNFEAVNTYYHIDQIMRHLNVELGVPCMPFQYATGVRFDPSGLSGADNSHYTPSTGQLAFGEGGVDDAEDADVIIHELGHGIHDWLTAGGLSQVNGLSEGLGDYNAQSYSRSLGQWASNETHYDWTFDWDGHNPFWPGRVTNYAPTYPGGLDGEVHDDGQIWCSSLMKIWNDVGRNKTDKAVWEGIAMTNGSTNQNDAAHAVLQAAVALGYTPAEVNSFVTHFQATGYDVSTGVDLLSEGITDVCPTDVGNQNGVIEPGEDVTISVTVKASTFARTGVSGTLSTTTPGVTILDNSATWPDIAAGNSASTLAPHFKIRLNGSVACLSNIDFQVSLTSNEGGPFLMTFSKPVGQAALPTGLPVAIPDNVPAGATSIFSVPDNLTLSDVNVRVQISHTWVGDLFIKLKSPLGTEVTLLDRPGVPASTYGCSDNDMNVTFDDVSGFTPESFCNGATPWFAGTAKPVGLLSAFNGQSTQGNWTLTVSDNAGSDVGSLVAWELISTPPLVGQCETCNNTAAVPLPSMGPGGLALATGHPTPFSSTTQIEYQLARSGRATLRVYDIAGQLIATLVDGEMAAGAHVASWNGTDQSGQPVASGIYFYRLASAGADAIRRTLLVR